ncbi:MAG: argininosuccinate synthase [Dermatophilaceae bacterium]
MKIVLAYSGGLDTSIALAWLREAYDAEVIAFCANIGQFEDLSEAEERAMQNGASKVYVEDLREPFLADYAFRALRADAVYEGKYLMAASLSRPLIAERLVQIAAIEDAQAVAHGATGKGNDQVRFAAAVAALNPRLRVIAPLMEWDLKTRPAQIRYAQENGVSMPAFKTSPYSRDTNIWGASVECGPLDDISLAPPEEAYVLTASPLSAPDQPQMLSVTFEQGTPTTLDGQALGTVRLVERLNDIGGRHGVGRIDIIENRLVGIKVRGVYESPAATILYEAHRELDNPRARTGPVSVQGPGVAQVRGTGVRREVVHRASGVLGRLGHARAATSHGHGRSPPPQGHRHHGHPVINALALPPRVRLVRL